MEIIVRQYLLYRLLTYFMSILKKLPLEIVNRERNSNIAFDDLRNQVSLG